MHVFCLLLVEYMYVFSAYFSIFICINLFGHLKMKMNYG